MAVVTAEAVQGDRSQPRAARQPSATAARATSSAPAALGLIGTVLVGAGIAITVVAPDPAVRILALVAVAAGGYIMGRAGVAPAPDDSDLKRRDELLRLRERALGEREVAVDGALVTLALRGDDRGAAQAVAAAPDDAGEEPLEAPSEPGEPRSRRPGLRAVPGASDPLDDGLPGGGEDDL